MWFLHLGIPYSFLFIPLKAEQHSGKLSESHRIDRKNPLCALGGGKIIVKGFHISWFLPSFNRVIFHLIDICSRIGHNTVRTASCGTMWLDISHEKEVGLRSLAPDCWRKWDMPVQTEAVSCPQFQKHWVKGCLGEVDRSKCYCLLNSTRPLREELHQDMPSGEVEKKDQMARKLRNANLCRNHRIAFHVHLVSSKAVHLYNWISTHQLLCKQLKCYYLQIAIEI